jgi:bis(5'-nucleosyl)-tetraphosphatase (symmetrical)
MEFTSKEAASGAPVGFMPWFDVPGRQTAHDTIAFGHWSTLRWPERSDIWPLDSGCVWGGALTAVRLQDREVFQVKCPKHKDPAAH